MARAVGLDIGARFIKVVELVGGPRSFKIQRVAIREIPGTGPEPQPSEDLAQDIVIEEEGAEPAEKAPAGPTREERISDLLAEVFGSLHLPREDVCAALGSGSTVFREIQVPFFEEDQIRKVVRFEAENHLHRYSVDDVVVNWVKTGQTKDGSRLTIFATPKQDLAEHVALMRRARIDPASVDLDSTAIFTALEATGVFTDHPNAIAIDVGAATTTLLLVVDGSPRVLRSFRLGVGSLEAGITSDLGVSPGEGRERTVRPTGPAADDLFVPAAELLPSAQETRKSLAQIQSDVVVERRMDFVRKLHREAIRSLASVSTEAPPDRILLLGGGALIPGIAEALSERFGLPAERVDLLERVECKDPGADAAFTGATIAPALGCGLRMLGRNPLKVELLQDEFAPRNTFEVVRTTLATAITLLFLVIGIWTYGIKEQLKVERLKYNEKASLAELMTFKPEIAYLQGIENKTTDLAEREAKNWIRALPRDETRILKLRNRLIQRHRFLQSELGLRSDIPQLPSAVKCWFEMYKALSSVPRERLGTFFQVEELTIQERRATIRIIVDDRAVFDEVRGLLSKSAYFKERAFDPTKIVEPGAEQTLPGGRKKQSFSFKFRED
jgi:type IV pilus assembly protein PilM